MRTALTALVLLAVPVVAVADDGSDDGFEFTAPKPFVLEEPALGGARAAEPTPAYLTSSRIAAVGDGALAIDADSGNLLLVDAAGGSIAQLAIGHDAGLLAYDPIARRAYVADRRGDRVVVVDVGRTLAIAATWKTVAEPYGVALTPDRATVLVTTIADRRLVAFDATTGRERWRTPIGAEARGIAVAPDGSRALIAYLVGGLVDELELRETHVAAHVALPVAGRGERARGAYVATFLGAHLSVVPFEREIPAPPFGAGENTGSYGGGFLPPITQQLAFVAGGAQPRLVAAQIAVHQPRAIAWDQPHDALYLAGPGNDELVQLRNASQVDVVAGSTTVLTGKDRCGPDGLAIASDGNVLVWCGFTRSVARVVVIDAKAKLASRPKLELRPALVASTLAPDQHAGMVLFHTANDSVSAFGQLACASCHFEGRADGLSWRIQNHDLQTPMLAGRLVGTAPFKWDGGAKDLTTSLHSTVKRLGGNGIGKRQTAQLVAYLEALPAVRVPTREASAVKRGKQLFDSAELGCVSCHDGPAYTDGLQHKLAGAGGAGDTPSLIGLAASAPYFHDGSAATLPALLHDHGGVHGMADAATRLDAAQVADLTAFLETL